MAFRVNLPPATRTLLISVLALSFLYNIARWRQLGLTPTPSVPYLTLIPARFIFYPWTLLTATFVEQNIFTVILNAATLFYGGKYLERAWGSREFGKFIVIVALVSNAVTVLLYLIWDSFDGDHLRGYDFFSHDECTTDCSPADTLGLSRTPICGGVALQGAFLVAFKQLVPEHTVTILRGVIKVRVKHFPSLFLLLNTISGVAFGTDTAAVLAWVGLLTSWTYLRFYKRQPDLSGTSTSGLGIKGDASETFAFAGFFPDAVQPAISLVADKIFDILVSVKVCTPFSDEAIASSNEQVLARGEAGLPSLLNNGRGGTRGMGKREEAERRRALALKALDQRLQAATAARAQSQSGVSSPPTHTSSPVATATVSSGQGMLGETNYAPDHS
ncbi:rhomboid family protein [Paecilomyces variotii]|uniref:Rhomboid family protein n=1 Tax=Byssochlamys spectabilis TaxID=264951 RepID=A0A443HXY0_BYSSP|nr:rhomboid family protein [Paecilomyces variotii]RWQ96707.1 rhomboid family protein [Paecilomyces variotii]